MPSWVRYLLVDGAPAAGPPAIAVTDRCNACGVCVEICPQMVLELAGKARAVYPERCIRCGHCVVYCPVDAVDHDAVSKSYLVEIPKGGGTDAGALTALFAARRSCRAFKPESVPRATVEELINRATTAYPSAHNGRPVEVVAVDDGPTLQALRDATVGYYRRALKLIGNRFARWFYRLTAGRSKAAGVLALLDEVERLVAACEAGRDRLFHGAPILVVFHTARGAIMPQESSDAAAAQFVLMAEAMSLGTCHIGWFTAAANAERTIIRTLGIPAKQVVTATFALGIPKYQKRHGLARGGAAVRWA